MGVQHGVDLRFPVCRKDETPQDANWSIIKDGKIYIPPICKKDMQT